VPNRPFAFGLFLSSYSPALLILAVRSFNHSWLLFWISLGVAVVSSVGFLIFLWAARSGGPFEARVSDVEQHDADLAAYVATYLLPFIVVFDASIQDVIALALFLVFIGTLWVNSSLLYLNPLLSLAGYHVYVARITPKGVGEADSLTRGFLISHQSDLQNGDAVYTDKLGHGSFIDVTQKKP
jgi:hypothetical protein